MLLVDCVVLNYRIYHNQQDSLRDPQLIQSQPISDKPQETVQSNEYISFHKIFFFIWISHLCRTSFLDDCCNLLQIGYLIKEISWDRVLLLPGYEVHLICILFYEIFYKLDDTVLYRNHSQVHLLHYFFLVIESALTDVFYRSLWIYIDPSVPFCVSVIVRRLLFPGDLRFVWLNVEFAIKRSHFMFIVILNVFKS